jgi:hypothetical protein
MVAPVGDDGGLDVELKPAVGAQRTEIHADNLATEIRIFDPALEGDVDARAGHLLRRSSD